MTGSGRALVARCRTGMAEFGFDFGFVCEVDDGAGSGAADGKRLSVALVVGCEWGTALGTGGGFA